MYAKLRSRLPASGAFRMSLRLYSSHSLSAAASSSVSGSLITLLFIARVQMRAAVDARAEICDVAQRV